MAAPTNRESDRFMLRLPDGMRDELKAHADANGRSMNAEIVRRLEETLRPATGAEATAALEKIRSIVNEAMRAGAAMGDSHD